MNFPLKKYFVKKESWKRFGVKAGVTLVVLWAAGAAFASRYRIGIDPQQEKCLPGYLRVSKLGGIRWWLERVAELFQLYWESTDGRFRW